MKIQSMGVKVKRFPAGLLLAFTLAAGGCETRSPSSQWPLKGTLTELLALDETVVLEYKQLLPPQASPESDHVEILLSGAWMLFDSESGKPYVLRILPHCRARGERIRLHPEPPGMAHHRPQRRVTQSQ